MNTEQSSLSIVEQLVAGISSPNMRAARGELAVKTRDAVYRRRRILGQDWTLTT
jgi:hypothetical protein